MDNILVTILITSRDRPDDLRFTLTSLRQQTYSPLEIIVIDDGSERSFESALGKDFPEVRFVRHETSHGLIASRSGGFRLAAGQFLISLDDDSNFCHPNDISLAVARMEQEKDVALLAFRIIEGREVAAGDSSAESAYYCHTYVGCGHMFRKEATDRVGSYMDFYQYGGEEEEYGLRALDEGWKLVYFPQVVVHHRVSRIGRSRGRILAYVFRNMVWTLFLRMPFPYAVAHSCSRCVSFFLRAAKEGELSWFRWSLWETVKGMPLVFRLRRPVKWSTFWLWQFLRRKEIRTARDFEKVCDASSWRAISLLTRQLFRRSPECGSAS